MSWNGLDFSATWKDRDHSWLMLCTDHVALWIWFTALRPVSLSPRIGSFPSAHKPVVTAILRNRARGGVGPLAFFPFITAIHFFLKLASPPLLLPCHLILRHPSLLSAFHCDCVCEAHGGISFDLIQCAILLLLRYLISQQYLKRLIPYSTLKCFLCTVSRT